VISPSSSSLTDNPSSPSLLEVIRSIRPLERIIDLLVASTAQEYVTTDQFTATDYAFIQILAGQTLTSEQFSIEPETSATTTATYVASATAAATPPGTKSGTESGAATIKPSSILTVFGLVIGMLIL